VPGSYIFKRDWLKKQASPGSESIYIRRMPFTGIIFKTCSFNKINYMKGSLLINACKAFTIFLLLSMISIAGFSQDNTINVNGEDIGAWFSRNWMWVAGGFVVLLLLIGLFSSGSRTKRKTTIVREEDANGIIRTTTTEIKE
jgi:hypothetical protein